MGQLGEPRFEKDDTVEVSGREGRITDGPFEPGLKRVGGGETRRDFTYVVYFENKAIVFSEGSLTQVPGTYAHRHTGHPRHEHPKGDTSH